MASLLPSVAAAVAVLLLLPAIAGPARRLGAKARGGLMVASVLLGLGAVLDPPTKHVIEAAEPPTADPEAKDGARPAEGDAPGRGAAETAAAAVAPSDEDPAGA